MSLMLLSLTLLAVDAQPPRIVRVGVFQMPPLVVFEPDLRVSGIMVDILESIAVSENWKVEFVPCTWTECLQHIKDGSLDFACLLADRPERRDWARFNRESIYVDWGQLWVPKGSDVDELSDLKGKTVVGIVQDVFSSEFGLLMKSTSINANYLEVQGYDDMAEMLRAGVADAVVLNRVFKPDIYGMKIVKTNIIFSPVALCFAFPLTNSDNDYLINRIDENLRVMKHVPDSAYNRGFDQWLNHGIRASFVKFRWIGAGVLAVLAGLILFRGMRKRARSRLEPEPDIRGIRAVRSEPETVSKGDLYLRVFNSINDGILICGLGIDGQLTRIDLVNKQMCLIFGRSEEQLKLMNPDDLVAESDRHRIPELTGILQSRHTLLCQLAIRTGDGGLRQIEANANLYETGDGWKVLVVVRDVSERFVSEHQEHAKMAQLEAQFQQRTMEIEEMSREVNLLAGTLSHDLQSPLRTVQETLQKIRRKQESDNPEQEEGLDYAIFQVQKINNLIKGILDYSRMSRVDLELVPLGLSQICSEVLLQMDEMIRLHKADIIIERPMPRVIGHANTLFRVIQNLVVNAMKFVEKGKNPRVILRAESREQKVCLWVIDNGIGVAPEYHDRIFNVFQRLHSSEEYSGNGLGLAIVKRGVQRMNGTLGLISEIGEGSRFWIELDAGPSD